MEKNLHLDGVRAVLFDWDNTLADTRSLLLAAVNRVLQEYNLPEWFQSSQKIDSSLSFRDNFPNIFGNKAPDAYQRYVEIYQQIAPHMVQTFPGVSEVLSFLHRREIPLYILSNKDRCLLELELNTLFSFNWFKGVTAGREAPADKPDPRHLFFALRDEMTPAEITPESVWMVGDSAQDSCCARSASAAFIQIGSPIWSKTSPVLSSSAFFPDFFAFLGFLEQQC